MGIFKMCHICDFNTGIILGCKMVKIIISFLNMSEPVFGRSVPMIARHFCGRNGRTICVSLFLVWGVNSIPKTYFEII
jgi:hypothetical protein